jgi:hypothetical protein
MLSPRLSPSALCRRLAVLRQRLFELLFDAEGIGGGARPEFPQGMPVALVPENKSLRVFPALAEERDDAVGELAEGHRVEGRGVEPVDDERAVAADPFEAFACRAFRCRLGGIQSQRRLLDFFADEGVAEVLRPALADGLGFRTFGEQQEGHVSPAQTIVQTCIVHLIRNSMDFASWKDRKAIAAALKTIYRANDADAGRQALDEFDAGPWGNKYPAVAQSWRRNWDHVIPFFAFPATVRRIIYTTNAIEALNAKLRRAVRTRGHFPTDEAAMKLSYLVLRQVAGKWKMPPREWCEAKTQFAIMFDERFVAARWSTRPPTQNS